MCSGGGGEGKGLLSRFIAAAKCLVRVRNRVPYDACEHGLTLLALISILRPSHIHLWDVHLKRPPTFAEAWTHLARESCTCMCILDGDLAGEKVLKALGIPPVAEGKLLIPDATA